MPAESAIFGQKQPANFGSERARVPVGPAKSLGKELVAKDASGGRQFQEKFFGRLQHDLATGHEKIDTGEKGRFLGNQIRDRMGDVLDGCQSAQGRPSSFHLEDALMLKLRQLGTRQARRDHVHPDAVARPLRGERLGESLQGMLGSHIVGHMDWRRARGDLRQDR